MEENKIFRDVKTSFKLGKFNFKYKFPENFFFLKNNIIWSDRNGGSTGTLHLMLNNWPEFC